MESTLIQSADQDHYVCKVGREVSHPRLRDKYINENIDVLVLHREL